jgi:hypothetical protein
MIDKLKIIPIDQILHFEASSEERSAKLASEIAREGKLHHPLLVTPIGNQYLLLDDASVVMALKSMNISDIPVQLADHHTLSVHSWQRVVENWHPEDMIRFAEIFPRLIHLEKSPTTPLQMSQAEIFFKDRSRFRMSLRTRSTFIRADLCARFCFHMEKNHGNFRTKIDRDDPEMFRNFPRASAVIFPPLFTVDELSALALKEVWLPQGIVRIDQPGRVLGIDFSLAILMERVPREEKESFLKQMIRMRISSDRTAYYNGSVFMFNS